MDILQCGRWKSAWWLWQTHLRIRIRTMDGDRCCDVRGLIHGYERIRQGVDNLDGAEISRILPQRINVMFSYNMLLYLYKFFPYSCVLLAAGLEVTGTTRWIRFELHLSTL